MDQHMTIHASCKNRAPKFYKKSRHNLNLRYIFSLFNKHFFFMQFWVYLAILSIYGDFKYFWQFCVFFWRYWVLLLILSIYGNFEFFWRFWVFFGDFEYFLAILSIFFTILSIFDSFEQLVWLECSFQALTIGTTYIWFLDVYNSNKTQFQNLVCSLNFSRISRNDKV